MRVCVRIRVHVQNRARARSPRGGDVRRAPRVRRAFENTSRQRRRGFRAEARAGHRRALAPPARERARRLVRVRRAPLDRRGRAVDRRGILRQAPASEERSRVQTRDSPNPGPRVSSPGVRLVDGIRPTVRPDAVRVRRVVRAREPRQHEERQREEERQRRAGAHLEVKRELIIKTRERLDSPGERHTFAASTCARRSSSAPPVPARSIPVELASCRHPRAPTRRPLPRP